MTDDIQPRRDEHGVPWCRSSCPSWVEERVTERCGASGGRVVVAGTSLCEPQARRDAAELARLQRIEQRAQAILDVNPQMTSSVTRRLSRQQSQRRD